MTPGLDAAVVGRQAFLAQFGPAAPADVPPARPPAVPAVMLTPEQQAAVEMVLNWFENSDDQFLTLGGLAGTGKALALDTPLATPSGWTTMGQVVPGDSLFDEVGNVCVVTGATGVMHGHDVFRVTFDDGSAIDADADHLWVTKTDAERTSTLTRTDAWRAARRARRSKTHEAVYVGLNTKPVPAGTPRTTAEIKATLLRHGRRRNHSVALAGPLSLPDVALPIPPYTLGVWLGDGDTSGACVTSNDPDVMDMVRADGYTVTKHAAEFRYGVLGLKAQLRGAGLLGHKHIPAAYLRASKEQRMRLLQGLLDSDGFSCGASGSIELSFVLRELTFQAHELMMSLGLKASAPRESEARLYGRVTGPRYRINLTTDHDVFRLARKRARIPLRCRNTQRNRYIVSVEPIDSVPVKCIAVDSPSSLYLAGRAMIPTHNTTLIRHLCDLGFADVTVLAPTGKACQVLRRKGVPANTIHSFRYDYIGRDEKNQPKFRAKDETESAELLICDEASMVTTDVHEDLLSTGFRVLYVGDHGQLPPVGRDPGLMSNPTIRLETVMRQALESPILRFAHDARTYVPPRPVDDPAGLVVRNPAWLAAQSDSFLASFDIVLTSFNAARIHLNTRIRAHLGRKDRIEIGDRIICLKNQRNRGLFNGMVVTVCGIDRECIDVETDDGRFIYGLQPWWEQFGRAGVVDLGRFSKFSLFDYAYAITGHKSQGSEWNRVLVIEEYSRLFCQYRWRYTTATRAAMSLTYVTNDCPVVS